MTTGAKRQAEFDFSKPLPPSRAPTVRHKSSDVARALAQRPAPVTPTATIIPKPVESHADDEKSAIAVGGLVEALVWEKGHRFALFRAQIGLRRFATRKSVWLVAAGVVAISAASYSAWRPLALSAFEWLRGPAITAPPPQKPRLRRPRVKEWWEF